MIIERSKKGEISRGDIEISREGEISIEGEISRGDIEISREGTQNIFEEGARERTRTSTSLSDTGS